MFHHHHLLLLRSNVLPTTLEVKPLFTTTNKTATHLYLSRLPSSRLWLDKATLGIINDTGFLICEPTSSVAFDPVACRHFTRR